ARRSTGTGHEADRPVPPRTRSCSAAFWPRDSWKVWKAVLLATVGEVLTAAELELFRSVAGGRTDPPSSRVRGSCICCRPPWRERPRGKCVGVTSQDCVTTATRSCLGSAGFAY